MEHNSQKYFLLIIYFFTIINIIYLVFSIVEYYNISDDTGIFFLNLVLSISLVILFKWIINYSKIKNNFIYKVNLLIGYSILSFYIFKILKDLYIFFTYS